MSACSPPSMTDADFEKLCQEEAYVKILDPILWERYVKLATENSARIDGKPTLVEMDGFTVLFDENRGATSSDFPIGTHDQETVILYNGTKIAILFEKIRTVEGYYGPVSRGCYSFSGLETYIQNRKSQ